MTSRRSENRAWAREPATIGALPSLLTPGDERRVPIVACLDVGHQCVPGSSGGEADPYPLARAARRKDRGPRRWPGRRPGSIAWQMRARVGERVRWYEEREDVRH